MSALQEIFSRFTTQFDDSALEQGAASTESLTDKLQGLGKLLLGSALVIGARNFARESARIGDELDKTSKVIGIDTQALQAWRHAANLSGVDAGSFTTGMVKLQRSMYDAQRGTATALEPFQRLGVAFEDAQGQLRPMEDVLKDLADPLANLESSSERVAILSTLMGRAGARVGPLFAEGAEGVERMQAELEALGGGASSEFIDAAAELTDANARLDMAFLSLRSRIATVVLPIVQRGVEAFTDMSVAFGKVLKDTKLVEAGLTIIGAVAAAIALKMIIAFAPLILQFAAIAAVIIFATLVVEDFLFFLEGKDSVLTRFADSINDFIDTGEGVSWLADVWGQLRDVMSEVFSYYFGEDLPNPEEFTTQRGLVAPSQGFRTNAEAKAQARANTDALGGNRFARARNRARNRQTIAGLTTNVQLPARTSNPGILARETGPVGPWRAGQEPSRGVTVVQNTTVNGTGLDERRLLQMLETRDRRARRAAVESASSGEGEL